MIRFDETPWTTRGVPPLPLQPLAANHGTQAPYQIHHDVEGEVDPVFNITFQSLSNKCMNYALSGDLRACHLARLERVVRGCRSHGISVCFDIDEVTSIDEGVLQFFIDGAGCQAELSAQPTTIINLLDYRNATIRSHTTQNHS